MLTYNEGYRRQSIMKFFRRQSFIPLFPINYNEGYRRQFIMKFFRRQSFTPFSAPHGDFSCESNMFLLNLLQYVPNLENGKIYSLLGFYRADINGVIFEASLESVGNPNPRLCRESY